MSNLPSFELKPHQLTPLLATPRTIAMLFVGASAYVGFIDPKVRQSLNTSRLQLKHWKQMYSRSIGVMGSLAVLGAVFGGLCYYKTKQNLWLVGGAIMGSLWPYTLIALMPTNKNLMKLDESTNINTEFNSEINQSLRKKFAYWVNLHRGRVLISVVAVAVFYLAELKSTENVSLSVNLK